MRRGLRTIVYDDTIPEEQSYESVMPSQAPAMDNYMPEFPGMEDPSLRQIALADGGVVQREEYNIGGASLTKAQREQASQQKSVWLKTYSYDDLEKDIKAGKSKSEIADAIYNSNPKIYDQIAEERNIKNGREGIYSALEDRLKKRKDLFQTEKKLAAKELSNQEKAVKDISNYINKKKKIYKELLASNKIGSFDFFKKDVLDYAEKKYPQYVKSSSGDAKFISGQKIFTPFQLIKAKRTGEYGIDVALNKKIREALDIPERPKAGEGMTGDRSLRSYNKSTKELLDEAIKQGIIPKVDPKTGKPITTESQYSNYIKKSQINPVYNVFGKKYKFGTEHVGGISRAKLLKDPEALAKIIAMDPYTNRFVKSSDDAKITNLIKLANQSEPKKAKQYLNTANELIKDAETKYGLDLTKYKLQNNKIVPVHPKISLNDPLFDKVKRAINTFIATERHKEPAFKELPTELKQAITSYRKGNTSGGNRLLQSLIKKGGYASIVGLGGMALNDIVGGEALAEIPDTISPEQGGLTKSEMGVAGAGLALGTKKGRELTGKALLKGLSGIGTPLGLVGLTAGLKEEDQSILDALKEEAQAPTRSLYPIFAKESVKLTRGATSGLEKLAGPTARRIAQQVLNLGLPFSAAAKIATKLTPFGYALGAYDVGKLVYDEVQQEKARIAAMTPEERKQHELETENTMMMGEAMPENVEVTGEKNIPTTDDVINKYAYGGRVNFEKGSDPKDKPILPINPMIGGEDPRGSLQDPGRRDVLKGMGLLGAGVAAGKLGLLKLGKAIKKAPLTKIVKPMGKTMTQFPTWFPTLMNRIRKEGKQIPIFKTKDVNISKQEYDALKQQGTKNLFDRYIGRTENYVNELKQQGIPRYYQKVNTDEIIGYQYEVKDLPNVRVTDLAGKEIRIDFPNAYGKDVTMTYKAPKVSVDMQGKKVKYDAEFQVDDAVPESGGYPGDVPDFYGEIVNNLDEVYGGASQIEQYALKLKKPRTTQGDEVVNAWDAGQPHMSVKEIRELELKKQKKQGRRDYAKQQVDEKPATFEDREFLKNFLDAGDDID